MLCICLPSQYNLTWQRNGDYRQLGFVQIRTSSVLKYLVSREFVDFCVANVVKTTTTKLKPRIPTSSHFGTLRCVCATGGEIVRDKFTNVGNVIDDCWLVGLAKF